MLDKQTLGLAAEYAVASELCRRGIYAQLTIGHHKRADILAETEKAMIKIQVKAKQGREWPGVKGIVGKNIILILVDFENKKDAERPDFYILTSADWEKFIYEILEDSLKKKWVKIDEKNIPIWIYEKPPKQYRGIGIKSDQISEFKERWDKIQEKVI
jgi:hypothetical protein